MKQHSQAGTQLDLELLQLLGREADGALAEVIEISRLEEVGHEHVRLVALSHLGQMGRALVLSLPEMSSQVQRRLLSCLDLPAMVFAQLLAESL